MRVNHSSAFVKNRIVALAIVLAIGLAVCFLMTVERARAAENAVHDKEGMASNIQGMDRLRAGDHIGAERYFSESIKKNPGRKQFHNNLAVALMRQGEYRRAYEPLKKAISIDPEYAKALSYLAIVCFHLSRYKEAYAYYLLSRRADRGYTDSRFAKDRVIGEVERLSKKDPDNSVYKIIRTRFDDAREIGLRSAEDGTMDNPER